MITLAVISLKGGVGKTTVSLGLASAARSAELRTLVVDLDPQADATLSLDVQGQPTGQLGDVIDDPRRRTLRACTLPSGWSQGEGAPALDVAVGGPGTARQDRTNLDRDHLLALRKVLGKVAEDDLYDVVIVDCPPSLGGLTRIGLCAADLALVVTEPGVFSVAAAERSMSVITELRTTVGVPLHPLGILVNRSRGHIGEQRYRVEELRSLFGDLVLPREMPERTSVQRAQGTYTPIHEVRDAGGREAAGIFSEILERALAAR